MLQSSPIPGPRRKIVIASPRTFRCLNCNEMINDSMTQCRYCSATIDPVAAQLVAERQEKAKQAYSDASYLRTAVIAMFVFLGISFIPFVKVLGWGFVITFFVVLVLLVRWMMKCGRLVTNDADYLRARRSWRLSLVLWIVAIPIGFIIRPLVYLAFELATR